MYTGANALTPNYDLRARAREQLRNNWGKAVLVGLLFALITVAASAVPVLGALLVCGPLTLGYNMYVLKLKRYENPNIETLFEGFNSFGSSLVLFLLTQVFTFLWTLLFIIPGIIASIRYSQAFFIMNDNPGISRMEALKMSCRMMEGYKWKYFMLCLSFLGWILLCSFFTLGIGFIWLYPYMYTAFANFYDDIKDAGRNSQNGWR